MSDTERVAEWLNGVFRGGSPLPLPLAIKQIQASPERRERVLDALMREISEPALRLHAANEDVDGGGYGRRCAACGKSELEITAYGIRECSGEPPPRHRLDSMPHPTANGVITDIEATDG
jgi:hypothetical protein